MLGPGLLESAYERCLHYEAQSRGLTVLRHEALPVMYRGLSIDCGFRLDLLVEGLVIVEVKAVKALAAIHRAQLLTYLRLTGCQVGLLINFNQTVLKDGIVRLVNTRA